jgi:hypothetical protein
MFPGKKVWMHVSGASVVVDKAINLAIALVAAFKASMLFREHQQPQLCF